MLNLTFPKKNRRALEVGAGKSGRLKQTPVIAEALRIEMMAAGECLRNALEAQIKLGGVDAAKVGDVSLIAWKESRQDVEHLAQEYALAIDRWRNAVERAASVQAMSAVMLANLAEGAPRLAT